MARSRRKPPRSPLAPPPRAAGVSARLVALFGGGTQFLGWMFASLGTICVLVFSMNADWAYWRFALAKTERATALVDRVEMTAFSTARDPGLDGPGSAHTHRRGERRVYAVHYTYSTADGSEHRGVSYGENPRWAPNTEAPVRYLAGEPGVSRLSGLRGAPVVWWLGAIPPLFAAVGAYFLIPALRGGWWASSLLRHGAVAQGTLVEKHKTNVTNNNRRVWRFTYEFADETGARHRVSARTNRTRQMKDEPTETILYRPSNPSQAVVLDALPESIGVDETGRPWAPARAAVAAMLAPGLFAAVAAAWLAFRAAG